MTSRRIFLRDGAGAAAGMVLAPTISSTRLSPVVARAFVDLNRSPDSVAVETGSAFRALAAVVNGRWEADGIAVTCTPAPDALRVTLTAPGDAIKRLRLRWRGRLAATRLLLGDAWERAYGDLEWRGMAPDRVMPWYFAAWDGNSTHAYGVRTGANAFCFWQADPDGITLWADVRSGGVALELGDRELTVCDVISQAGSEHRSSWASLRAFCQRLCAAPRLPAQPVYGHNDWYYAYGNNSEASVLADSARIVELSPTGTNRPYAVIDDGWQPERGAAKAGVGRWDHGNERFPDMAALADRIGAAGAVPGIWIRPLIAPQDAPDGWRLARARSILDPTVPDVLHKVAADIRRVRDWGYRLIKHDYSTFDIVGRWGSQMGSSLTREGWRFAAGSGRTTAEVITDFYRAIREAAGDSIVIGCNTVNHLAAGFFEICRIGDDTSGTEWERVPKMGVNALAFRGAQHGAFYAADPDCVGVTKAIPWALNRQWLDLLAHSGTTLLVSLAPDAVGAAERTDLRAALALAARPQSLAEPLDWQGTTWPSRWRVAVGERDYHWVAADGLGPNS